MRYDFRKVQQAFNRSGKTLQELEKITGLHNATISRVLRSGKAHQSTAVRLINALNGLIDGLNLTMDDIQVRGKKTA